MPIKASDLPSSDHLKMLVLGAPRIGKTRLLATAPKPIYVICSDDESKLDSAARVSKDFEYDPVNSTDGPRLLGQMESALKTAASGVAAGKYKTVVWDTLSSFADYLIAAELAASVKNGAENPMTAYPSFARRVHNYVGRILSLKAHVVVMCHHYRESKALDGQLAKEGEGIVPGIPGKERVKLGGMFRDVVYLEKKGATEDRQLVCSIKGVWGPGSNTLPGRESVPADLTEFLRLGATATAAPTKTVTKPSPPKK